MSYLERLGRGYLTTRGEARSDGAASALILTYRQGEGGKGGGRGKNMVNNNNVPTTRKGWMPAAGRWKRGGGASRSLV